MILTCFSTWTWIYLKLKNEICCEIFHFDFDFDFDFYWSFRFSRDLFCHFCCDFWISRDFYTLGRV